MSANGDEDNSFAWDDTVLIKAYDNSLNLAREELARRIAASTNNRLKQSSKPADDELEGAVGGEESPDTTDKVDKESAPRVYKVGDFVRAAYDADGVDYEAVIESIDSDDTCILRYLGYDNYQSVRLTDLVPTWGKKARRAQIAEVKGDADSEVLGENMSIQGTERKKQKNQKKTKSINGRVDAPPKFSMFGMQPPPPPVPPIFATSNNTTEDSEHLSAMLMSWYMSGYYTGVYQGVKMSKQHQKKSKK